MQNTIVLFGADVSSIVVITACAFLLAGFVKGVIGLGLPTVAVGLLSLVMTPVEAATLLIVPSFVTNVWQLAAGPRLAPLLRRLWPMLVGVCAGTWLGAWLLTGDITARATTVLGIALVLYAGMGLASIRLSVPARAEGWLAPMVGAATGAISIATGVFVIPLVPYLQALDLDKEDLVQAMGLAFTVSTLALAAGLAHKGIFQASTAGTSFLALAPALVGMLLGQWLRTRVRSEIFRFCFFVGLLLLGAHLALRSVI
jgi:uncharacterized membrane protein YfcA